MQFLAPLFLVALAGLAIPVLLHLTQREKKQIIRFPSLMFVRRIPYQSVRRRKVQNWLLLLVRMTALALLIAAFARPFIMRPDAAAPTGAGAREVVVLLDTSYSIGYGDRWERARKAAEDVVSGLSPSDRASIVLFASGTEIVVRSTAEREKLTAALATAKPGSGATRYAPALKVAGSILSDSRLPRREAVLISDFQRSGWRGGEGTQLPQGAILTPVPVQGPLDRPNVGVTAVSLPRSTFSDQERVTVTAALVNRADRPANGVTVKLEVGKIPVGSKTISLEPGATTSVTFDPFTVNARNMRGTVSIGDDALAADNTYNFVVSPSQPLRVALLDRGAAGARRYIEDALSVGEMPRIDAVTRQPEGLTDDELNRSAVVIVHDVSIAQNTARRLHRFVEQGGGLLVAAGGRAAWPTDVDLLPVPSVPRTTETKASPRGWEPSSSGTRCSSRSAARAAATSRPPGCTNSGPSRRPSPRRCWRASTGDCRPCWSAAWGQAACSSGRRRSISRRVSCRSTPSFRSSSTKRSDTWRRTVSRSRGSPWGRYWIRRRWHPRKDRRRLASC